MSGLAIASLITAIVIAPVGIVLGFVALARLKGTAIRGRGLAITGIVVGFLVLAAGIAAAALFMVGSGSTSDKPLPADVSSPQEATVFQLTVGNCLQAAPSRMSDTVTVVPCSEPHGAQVISQFTPTTASYPSDEAQYEEDTRDACIGSIQPLIPDGITTDDLFYSYLRPSKADWVSVKHSQCLVGVNDGGTITGSLLDGTLELQP